MAESTSTGTYWHLKLSSREQIEYSIPSLLMECVPTRSYSRLLGRNYWPWPQGISATATVSPFALRLLLQHGNCFALLLRFSTHLFATPRCTALVHHDTRRKAILHWSGDRRMAVIARHGNRAQRRFRRAWHNSVGGLAAAPHETGRCSRRAC